ncbi:Rho GTPase-activating protein domain [Sesbania bispinosa]|nr:Rho GTPase-activating protein domain [Sesbania bispinosa]
MTEVLHSPTSTSRFSSSSSSDGILLLSSNDQEPPPPSSSVAATVAVVDGFSTATDCDTREITVTEGDRTQEELSLLAILVTLLRKSLVTCKSDVRELCAMEIGWPTNVRHVAHVTFDRFNGFLGLPVEFEPEVPRRPPSARELPRGILDSLSPEQVMQCQTEEDCAELARQLPETEASLLDWAINLMADVAQGEHLNKMNAHNIAMVFAPNMTKMADPLTALMYAVQVMNFLKTLILRTLRERKDSVVETSPGFYFEPSDENGDYSPFESCQQDVAAENEEAGETFVCEETVLECSPESIQNKYSIEGEPDSLISSSENLVRDEDLYCDFPPKGNIGKSKTGQSSNSSSKKGPKKTRGQQPVILGTVAVEKKGISNLSCIDSRSERIEAWR